MDWNRDWKPNPGSEEDKPEKPDFGQILREVEEMTEEEAQAELDQESKKGGGESGNSGQGFGDRGRA